MEALIVLTLIGIFWLISPRRWRRMILAPAGILVLIYLGLTSPIGVALATQGLTASLPADRGEPVDAILVVGRGDGLRNLRIEQVEQLWQARRAPKIFASGMLDAEFIVDQLKEAGLPIAVLSGERCSQSTEENALFSAAVLGAQKIQKILLVTDPHHMLRSFYAFRSVGFTVTPHMTPLPTHLRTEEQVLLMLREYVGTAVYAVTGRLGQRTDVTLQKPPSWVTNRIAEWECKVPQA